MTNTRKEKIEKAKDEVFDVVVVGGGITGSGIVRDTALRGLRSLLIDKGDFASGTSSKSGKLVHGGLRYLKYGHFALVYESLRERELLYRVVAPHIVKLQNFYYPFYKRNHTPRWLVAMGLFLYDILSFAKNGFPYHFVSSAAIQRRQPTMRKEGLVGGLHFWDCTCLDARLVVDTLKSAKEAGAILLNYCKLVAWQPGKEGAMLAVRDSLSGERYTFRTRVLINAAGAWADDVLDLCQAKQRFGVKLTMGIHLLFRKQRLPIHHLLTMESVRDVRYLYVVPWGKHVLVGTTDRYCMENKDSLEVQDEDVQYLLDSLNYYFPESKLRKEDIVSSYVGVRPLVGSNLGKKEEEISRDYSILIEPEGIVSISGGKLTTYRSMAQKVVDKTIKTFFPAYRHQKCHTQSSISGGRKITAQEILNLFPRQEKHREALRHRYGSNCLSLLKIIEADPAKGERVHPALSLLLAEIDYFVQEEFAEKLTDILCRRTHMNLVSRQPLLAALPSIASYFGKLQGWDDRKIEEERILCEKALFASWGGNQKPEK